MVWLSSILKSLASKILGGLSGPAGWLVGLLIDKLIQKLTGFVAEWWRKRQLKKVDDKLLKEYNEAVQQGSNLSREERRKIAERLLNRDSS